MPTGFPNVSADIPGNPGFGSPGSIKSYGDFSSSQGFTVRDLQGRFTTGGWGFVWSGLQGVLDLPNNMEHNIEHNIAENITKLKDDIQQYARENAPWQDVTGNARRGLKAVSDVNERSGKYVINLGHSVSYGTWLETRNGGATAIVIPTLQHFTPQLMALAAKQ